MDKRKILNKAKNAIERLAELYERPEIKTVQEFIAQCLTETHSPKSKRRRSVN